MSTYAKIYSGEGVPWEIFHLLIWSKFTPRPFHLASLFSRPCRREAEAPARESELAVKQVNLGDLDIKYKSLLC